MRTVEEYLLHLEGKGFLFGEDTVGFIYFGKRFTEASDEITNTAIELTLKAQRTFDGSFYISLLEMLVANQIESRKQAIQFVKDQQILAI
ncbi:DUF6123 family protein [Cytobacillus sp. Hz8]|uniref:DUF6123 family protein n=1 Tax=Cytobacillus sp. Hz8 TaxID=3347168 RepID=UPI0035DFC757